ncbi:MAG: penicillin-binding protein activator LpoB [Treponemataceae bacterium]|nr:penicillin-binding protein activator LpoB [Treponemataceae bacterium]MDE7140296.1 penicillin-binding protein activator LpoB [Treponemataceae bacterium]
MNVKKIAAVVCAAWCAAAACAVDIETALQQVADQFSATIKRGSTIAIVGISSDSSEMSDFMLDDLTMRFVQARTLTVANRANLDAIKAEMNFQLSGEVSDDSIQQIGAMVGANIVVHGKLVPIGNIFNLTMQALDVTSAAVIDMCRIRVEPNDTTDYLFAQDGVPRKKAPVSKAASKAPSRSADRSTSKYSGDVQLRMGLRVASCGDLGGTGFLLGVRNCNLFNINDTIALGFFEDLSGSMFGNWGCNFVIGPALGINIKDVVKFVIAPGLLIGADYSDGDEYYDTNVPIGFALNVTAKFIPAKAVSPFVSIQYDVKDGYNETERPYQGFYDYDGYYHYGYITETSYDLLNAFDIAVGVSFNFGRRH